MTSTSTRSSKRRDTIALAEDTLVFDGNDELMVTGLVDGSPHDSIAITDDYGSFPALVAKAVTTLRAAGVDGPYGVALGTQCYTGVIETTEKGGYPVLEHLRLIAGRSAHLGTRHQRVGRRLAPGW